MPCARAYLSVEYICFAKRKKKHACTVRPGPLVVFEHKVSWLRKEHACTIARQGAASCTSSEQPTRSDRIQPRTSSDSDQRRSRKSYATNPGQ